MDRAEPEPAWRRAAPCQDGACVEVAASVDGRQILMRDSKNSHQLPLSFTLPEWEAFLRGVRDGEFDLP
jgi:hypothetical protein